MIDDAAHVDATSSERSESVGSTECPIFRKLEQGYVTIEEIREKLLLARDIRTHRASDPQFTNTTTPIQTSFVQRRSETSFSNYNNPVEPFLKWSVNKNSI